MCVDVKNVFQRKAYAMRECRHSTTVTVMCWTGCMRRDYIRNVLNQVTIFQIRHLSSATKNFQLTHICKWNKRNHLCTSDQMSGIVTRCSLEQIFAWQNLTWMGRFRIFRNCLWSAAIMRGKIPQLVISSNKKTSCSFWSSETNNL